MRSARLHATHAKSLEDYMWLEFLSSMKCQDLYVTWILVDSKSLRINDKDSRRLNVSENQQ